MTDTTLAILAGGQGRRMGRPKGELTVAGTPILLYLIDRFAWPGPTMLVTAPGREHPPGYQQFDCELIDPVADQGPLRGILTALENLTTEKLIIATVDMPDICRTQLNWLETNLASDKNGLLITRSNHVEPFPLIARGQAINAIRKQFESGSRSVKGLAQLEKFDCISAPESWNESVWTNLNFPKDIQNL